MPRHLVRGTLMLLPLVVYSASVQAHTVPTPTPVTQDLNRCLTMVRSAATRVPAAAQASKKGAGKSAQPRQAKARAAYDDYKIAAGTSLAIRLRTNLDSASGQVDDPVRATLTDAVMQEGIALIPAGSSVHGKITDVVPASRNNPLGHVVLEFHVVEHLETHSLATIATRPVVFDATPVRDVKLRDIQVAAGETIRVTLARPLIVHIPRAK